MPSNTRKTFRDELNRLKGQAEAQVKQQRHLFYELDATLRTICELYEDQLSPPFDVDEDSDN